MGIATPRTLNALARKKAVALRLELESRFPVVAAPVELVPMPCWGRNVRSRLRPFVWELIRQDTLEKSGVRCAGCGRRRRHWNLDCHEVWRYEDETLTQRLVDIVAMCHDCHEIRHLGFSNVMGRGAKTERRLQSLNGWTPHELEDYLRLAFALWEQRSRNNWRRDISWVAEQGYPYTPRKVEPAVRLKGATTNKTRQG